MPARIHGVATFGKRTRTYRIWTCMRNRCNNPRTPDYNYYGARGIRVCARWDSFIQFREDMGEAPVGLTLDRIDGSGDYAPGNCRWSTRQTQSRNRSYCKLTNEDIGSIRKEYVPGRVRQVDLAVKFGVTQSRVSQVLRGVV